MIENIENEIWKDIPNYPDYEISNLGRVKSLKWNKERMLKLSISSSGYYKCLLYKNNKKTDVFPHQLVAMVFLNHKINSHVKVVDHKDGNRLNNNVDNLRIVSSRQNNINYRIYNSDKYTSKYIGVYIEKQHNKNNEQRIRIRACIGINGKSIKLGTFKTELEAHNAYLSRLAIISCLE